MTFSRYSTHGARYQFGLEGALLTKLGLLNHCLRFDSPYHARLYRLLEAQGERLARVPLMRRGRGIMTTLAMRLGIRAFRALEKMRGISRNWLTVRIFLDQARRAENRVVLTSRHSESGLPLAALHWQFTEDDWRNADSFMEAFANELRRLDIGELVYQRPAPSEFTAVHSHFLGGTAMGADPAQSVVDADLKVHGVDNLYVSGPSVFPSYGYANPFYSIAALSLRLGDHLVEKLLQSDATKVSRYAARDGLRDDAGGSLA